MTDSTGKSEASATVDIHPRDRVCLDNGTTEYTVQAVSRAGKDIYITVNPDESMGTWVAISSVTRVVRGEAR